MAGPKRTALSLVALCAIAGGFAPAARAVFPGENGRIAFGTAYIEDVSGDPSIDGQTVWTALRGRRSVRVARGTGPMFSSEGRLAYASYLTDRIVTALGDGSRKRRVTRGTSPSWSPQGKALAFFREGVGVFVASDAGEHERQLLSDSGFLADLAWSLDGKALAFAGEDRLLRSVDVESRTVRQLGRGRDPAWLAGDELLFQRGRDVYVIDATGEERALIRGVQVQEPGAEDAYPPEYSVSPDGKRIAFARRGGIHVMSAVSGAARRITPRRSGACCPVFSPDGRRVAFVRGHGIFVTGRRGGRARLFTGIHDTGCSNPRECHDFVAALDWQAR